MNSDLKYVYKSQYLECFFLEGNSEYLLITFNEMGFTSQGTLWGENIARRMRTNTLGFVSTTPNWYPNDDFGNAVRTANEFLGDRFPERIAYGHSMGGYGAIKWSRSLKIDCVMAFCPQYSIDPADINDPRFNRYFRPNLNSGMAIDSSDAAGNIYVFYDASNQRDSHQVMKIAAKISLNLVPVANSGHETVKVFAGRSNFPSLLEICRHGRSDDLRQFVRAAARRGPERGFNIALRLVQSRPECACRIFDRYRHTISYPRWTELCVQLSRAGFHQQALGWLREAYENRPDDPPVMAGLARLLILGKNWVEAEELIKRLAEVAPGDPRYSKLFSWLDNRITSANKK